MKKIPTSKVAGLVVLLVVLIVVWRIDSIERSEPNSETQPPQRSLSERKYSRPGRPSDQDFYKLIGVAGGDSVTAEHITAALSRISECKSNRELLDLLEKLPPELSVWPHGEYLINQFWSQYSASDLTTKFEIFLDLGLEFSRDSKVEVSKGIFILLGEKVVESGFSHESLNGFLPLMSDECAKAFSLGFVEFRPSSKKPKQMDQAISLAKMLIEDGGDRFPSVGRAFSELLLTDSGLEYTIRTVVDKLGDQPLTQEAAYYRIVGSGRLNNDDIALFINSLNWGDRKREERFLESLISREIAQQSTSVEDGFEFLRGFTETKDQLRLVPAYGRVYGRRLGDDLTAKIPEDLSPEVRSAIITFYQEWKKAYMEAVDESNNASTK